jgi:hypothetical protein
MMHATNVQRTVALSRPVNRARGRQSASGPVITYVDPLGQDQPGDPIVTMTERQLIRIVFVAAETGARFERERIDMDPAAWLFAGRRLFHGRAAVMACRERDAFVRALLVHGLSIGLDASPEAVDALVAEDGKVVEPAATRPKRVRASDELQPA